MRKQSLSRIAFTSAVSQMFCPQFWQYMIVLVAEIHARAHTRTRNRTRKGILTA